MRGIALLVWLVGCGRIHFGGRPDDARLSVDTGTFDAAPLPTGPFSTPIHVPELASAFDDDDPTLTADQLEIYFNSNRAGGDDIWRATRASITDVWGPPEFVDELSEPGASENTPEISPDGLTIYIASNRSSGDDIYVFTRTNRTSPWSAIAPATELNDPAADVGVSLRADNLVLYMARLTASSSNEIMTASRASALDPWSTPVLVSELSSTSFDSDPAIASDGRTIYWGSRRATGNDDIWTASRSDTTQPFSNIAVATELNTSDQEADPWLSPDGHTMYMARDTGGGLQIYMATR